MEILAQIRDYRLAPIIRFTKDGFKEQPIKTGLALEKCTGEYEGQPTYIVIAFVRLTKEKDVAFESVGSRFIDEVSPTDYKVAVLPLLRFVKKWFNYCLEDTDEDKDDE